MSALQAEVEALRKQVAELQARCSEQQARPKIAKMSAEVVDSNPYRHAAWLIGGLPSCW